MENPLTPPNKGQRYPAEILTAEEVRALLRASSSRAPTRIRNPALPTVLYRGGLRISEALVRCYLDHIAPQQVIETMREGR